MNSTTRINANSVDRRRRLAQSRLCVLIDGASSMADFRQRITRLVTAGVDIIQLRDKRLPDREILERLHTLIEITRPTTTLAILNDRPDLARQVAADGVHVGQDDLVAAEAREIIGGGMILGISTHDIEQARQAVSAGADYLARVRSSLRKPNRSRSFRGSNFCARWQRKSHFRSSPLAALRLTTCPLFKGRA